MPIQAPQWTEFLSCPVCCQDFDSTVRGPISLGCGHTICQTCLANLQRKQCPFDQNAINTDIDHLPLNEALLQLVSNVVPSIASSDHRKLLPSEHDADYLVAKRCIEELALYLKPGQAASENHIRMSLISRPMQRKLVMLVGCQLIEPEGRARAVKSARSLGERSVTELILQHQNPLQLSANLWAAVRARGCQFLGPAMQEEVLKLVLLALEDGSALSRKVLVMFVVQRLELHFPQASKTSIGHVVQLLYRSSCFKVSKRDGDSSLMQLKEEFRTYESLRREHDAQIVQIATETGLRIAPDQWSALLYGDTGHKSHMQSIIDKLQTPQSFTQSVQELMIALQRTSDRGQLSSLRPQLELLAAIDSSSETACPNWSVTRAVLEAVKLVVTALVDYIQLHGSGKPQESSQATGSGQSKYKVSMCRNFVLRKSCPRTTNCTFAHGDMELDKYRSKTRKMRSSLPLTGISNSKTETKGHSMNGFTQAHDVDYYSTISLNHPQNDYDYSIETSGQRVSNENRSSGFIPNYVLGNPQPLPENQLDMHYLVHNAMIDCSDGNVNVREPDPCGSSLHMLPHKSSKKQQSVVKTVAILFQRRTEIINQLGTIVNKPRQDPHGIKMNSGIQGGVQGIHPTWGNGPSEIPFGPVNDANHYQLSDSMYEDEFVSFDAPLLSKYGPISRISKSLFRATNGSQPNEATNDVFNEDIVPSIQIMKPIPARSPRDTEHCGQQPYETSRTNSEIAVVPASSLTESQYPLGPPKLIQSPAHIQLMKHECMSKELILESQEVQRQLRHLEKKISDFKLTTQSGVFTEGERLAQELQIIEAGIREQEKYVHKWTAYGNVPSNQCHCPNQVIDGAFDTDSNADDI